MKQNKSFLLREIAGIPYILPFGQMIADYKRGLKTNATGVWLWNLLKDEHSLDEIITISAEYYGISESELPAFHKDITHFIHQLKSFGIIIDSADKHVPVAQTSKLLSIGRLTIKYIGPEDAFPSSLTDFIVTSAGQIHQTIYFHTGKPSVHYNGNVILRDSELFIMDYEDTYILLFPKAPGIFEIHLKKDASEAHCYCSIPPYYEGFTDADFFHAIRLLYLYLAQKHGMAALHSASILHNDKLWLFSGHSGIGKSTHTNLWKELYNTSIINGDLNLIAISGGTAVVHGIPWCGTSGIYDTNTYPLGGIILLNKSPSNSIDELTPDQKQLLVMQRLISPNWTRELWELNMDIIKELSDKIMICRLNCTKEYSAVELIKEKIEGIVAK